jgi:hypothetical protein
MDIAEMDAEIARMDALLRREFKGLIAARTVDVERATDPFMRELFQRDLEKLRADLAEVEAA